MLAWISENLAMIIITLVLVAIVTAIIIAMRKDKKAGKSSCGCNCAHCAMARKCHQPDEKKSLFRRSEH